MLRPPISRLSRSSFVKVFPMVEISRYADTSGVFREDFTTITERTFSLKSSVSETATYLSLPVAMEAKIRGTADSIKFPDATKALLKILPYVGSYMSKIFLATDTAQKRLDAIADMLARVNKVAEPAMNAAMSVDSKLTKALAVSAAGAGSAIILNDEALALEDGFDPDSLLDGSLIDPKVQFLGTGLEGYMIARDPILAGLQFADETYEALLAQVDAALPDLQAVVDAMTAIQTFMAPIKSAMLQIEQKLKSTVITYQPAVYFLGVKISDAKKATLAYILTHLSDFSQTVQNKVLAEFQKVLNSIGIDFKGISETINGIIDSMLAPVEAAMAQVESKLGELMEPLVEAAGAALDALNKAIAAVQDVIDAGFLFDKVYYGDEAYGIVDDHLVEVGIAITEGYFGLTGDDLIESNFGVDFLFGGAGNDTLNSGADPDEIYGGGGADLAYGGAETDLLVMGGGNDTAYGGAGDDRMFGNFGADRLFGALGNDMIRGGGGNDVMGGGSGKDSLYGDGGYDTIAGGDGNDLINGGAGNDSLYGEDGADVLNGGAGADLIFGQAGNDVLLGRAGADTLNGGAGGDKLFGQAGKDVLRGGAGTDRLVGGTGNDILFGGNDADVFVFRGAFGDDVIKGWEDGIDILDIGDASYSVETVGADAVIHVGANSITIDGAAGLIDADDFIL